MYLRFVKARIRPEMANDFESYYDEHIRPELQRTAGCLFAALMKGSSEPLEAVSMTIWDTRHDAERYELSGVYRSLLDQVRPFIIESDEWKMKLDDDEPLLKHPDAGEPEVTAFPIQTGDPDAIPDIPDASDYYLRIVSARVKPGELYRFIGLYEDELVPRLLGVDGCRSAFLSRGNVDPQHILSITLWDSQDHARAYETGGLFEELHDVIRPMLAETSEWRMALGSGAATEPKADDLSVAGWQVVSSNEFATVNAER